MNDMESFFEDKEEIADDSFFAIIEYGIHVSELYMESYVSNMSNYSFDTDFEENIQQMIEVQYGEDYELFDLFDDDDTNDDMYIDVILREIFRSVYSHVIPRRSYKKSWIRHPPNVLRICQQLEILRNKPQPEQRTDEWYLVRHNLITASNAWKCFESQSNQNQIIYEKCLPIEDKKFSSSVNTSSPLHWGQKFEPLSTQYYEFIYNTQIEDFGCIVHDTHTFLGASPDGIVVKETCQRYGRMLEIKNIVNREITQIPKKEYWVQMQLQMEVCDLNECDFLETKFVEYDNYSDFFSDGDNFNHTPNLAFKGAYLMFMDGSSPKYFYPEFQISEDVFNVWVNKILHENLHLNFIKTIYWRLEKVSCILVLRNNEWFQNSIGQMKNVWSQVLIDRERGYAHRAPNKRERKNTIDLTDETRDLNNPPKCLIADSSDDEKQPECLIADSSDDEKQPDCLVLDSSDDEADDFNQSSYLITDSSDGELTSGPQINDIVESDPQINDSVCVPVKKENKEKKEKKVKIKKEKKEKKVIEKTTPISMKVDTTSNTSNILDIEILKILENMK